MNQPKKNSIVAQANTELNSEAALKFLPLTSNKTGSTGPTLKDGDDGGPDQDILSYDIQVGLNGFFVTISFADAETPDARYIVHTMDEVVELLRGFFLKVLVVGLNPSKRHGKSPSLKNLFNWLDRLNLGIVSFTNLYEGYVPSEDNCKLDEIRLVSRQYNKVIALGNRTSDALRSVDIDHFKLPHPSGLNRLLNNPRFVDKQIMACKNYLYGGNDVL